MPETGPETRITRRLEFRVEGDDALPRTFSLVRWTTPQHKDGRRAGGWVDASPPNMTVLATGITRRELERLLGDGINWLAFDGEDG